MYIFFMYLFFDFKSFQICTHYLDQVALDMPNNKGETPLAVALRCKQLACAQQLINSGSNLSYVDDRWATILLCAAADQ